MTNIVIVGLFLMVALLSYLLWKVKEDLLRVLGHNVAMAIEYQRLSDEYKQYRADVVESLDTNKTIIGN